MFYGSCFVKFITESVYDTGLMISYADNEDSDQIWRMTNLLRVHTGTHAMFLNFVTHWPRSIMFDERWTFRNPKKHVCDIVISSDLYKLLL